MVVVIGMRIVLPPLPTVITTPAAKSICDHLSRLSRMRSPEAIEKVRRLSVPVAGRREDPSGAPKSMKCR